MTFDFTSEGSPEFRPEQQRRSYEIPPADRLEITVSSSDGHSKDDGESSWPIDDILDGPKSNDEGSGDGGGDGDFPERNLKEPEEKPARFKDLQPEGHIAARLQVSPYLKTIALIDHGINEVNRYPVPASKTDWSVPFPEYAPPLANFPLDASLLSDNPRPVDPLSKINERMVSLETGKEVPRDTNNWPLNVCGRTGLKGCGTFNGLGPHVSAIDLVIRRNPNNNRLEVLATELPDQDDQYGRAKTLPETSIKKGETYIDAIERLRRERGVEGLPSPSTGKIKQRGYADRPENADNAWSETKTNLTTLGQTEASQKINMDDRQQWAPINELLVRSPGEGIRLERHQAQVLWYIAEELFKEECKPQFPNSTMEVEGERVIERYTIEDRLTVQTASGDIAQMPFTHSAQREISKKYGPAPTVDYRHSSHIKFGNLPAEARAALEAAQAGGTEYPEAADHRPHLKRLVLYANTDSTIKLYTALDKETDNPIISFAEPSPEPSPELHDQLVSSVNRISSGFIILPGSPGLTPALQTYNAQQIVKTNKPPKSANAFWVSGNPQHVTDHNRPELGHIIIFPVEYYFIEVT